MTESRKTARGASPAFRHALLVSVVFHALLVLGFSLVEPTRDNRSPCIDTRISQGPFWLSIEDGPGRKNGKGKDAQEESGHELISVRVNLAPSSPSDVDAGPAPAVSLPGRPGSVSGEGNHPGEGGKGGGTGARFYSVPIKDQAVVFVIDRSISMGLSGALRAARAELKACLRALPPTARFQVVFYSQRAELLSGRPGDLLPADVATVARMVALVERIPAEDGTDHLRALLCGLELSPAVLFLVTDGDGLEPAQVQKLTRINRGRAAINVIDVGRGSPLLKELALANRGLYLRH
jgi:hypothetical protein